MTGPLRTDFKNEILPDGMAHRTYNVVSSTGETLFTNVHLEKAYVPIQVGDEYGEDEINQLDTIVNRNVELINKNGQFINKNTQSIKALGINKVDKDGDKVLSTHDFTTQYKTKLDNLESVFSKLGNCVINVMKDITIQPESWVDDSTFIDYPFKATISNSELTELHWWCELYTPDHTDLSLLNLLCPLVFVGDGNFSLFTKFKFATPIKIENIVFEREVLK